MEEVTEGVNNLAITEPHKKNRIQVSNTKKPLFFYVNLAKVRFFLRFFSFFFLFDCLGGLLRIIEPTARMRFRILFVHQFFLKVSKN
jgi:hypothetical protein